MKSMQFCPYVQHKPKKNNLFSLTCCTIKNMLEFHRRYSVPPNDMCVASVQEKATARQTGWDELPEFLTPNGSQARVVYYISCVKAAMPVRWWVPV